LSIFGLLLRIISEDINFEERGAPVNKLLCGLRCNQAMKKLSEGDKSSLTVLYDCMADQMYALAFSILKNPADAEDLVQNTFIKLWQEQKEFDSRDHIRAWLIRVAVNEGKKHLRSPWRSHVPYEEYAASLNFPAPEQQEVWQEVMALPRKYRMPIYLHYYEGYTTQEIARLLGIPHATVRTQLRRGRQLLRTQLQEVEFDEI
jgi:RNA polymerase sigma-70 factor (ECF subfamily)